MVTEKKTDGPETRPRGRFRRPALGKGWRANIAGVLGTRRDNPGGDTSTLGALSASNSSDGASGRQDRTHIECDWKGAS